MTKITIVMNLCVMFAWIHLILSAIAVFEYMLNFVSSKSSPNSCFDPPTFQTRAVSNPNWSKLSMIKDEQDKSGAESIDL